MTTRLASFAVFLAFPLSLAATARADPPAPSAGATAAVDAPPASQTSDAGEHFGARGTRVLGLDFDTGVANSGLASRPLGLGVRPTLDTFVFEGFSVGASMGFEYARALGNDVYTVGGGPRVGYALRLGDRLAIWPKLFVSLDVGSVPLDRQNSATLEDVRIGGHLPITIALGTNVLLEVGPVYSTDLFRSVGGNETARVDLLGLRTGIIGWF